MIVCRPRPAARGRSRSWSILLRNVLTEATSIVRSIERIAAAARAGSKDLDAAPLLLTTQQQVRDTVANVAAYGGSLDVIVDDAYAAAGVLLIIAVVLIVAALVFFLDP